MKRKVTQPEQSLHSRREAIIAVKRANPESMPKEIQAELAATYPGITRQQISNVLHWAKHNNGRTTNRHTANGHGLNGSSGANVVVRSRKRRRQKTGIAIENLLIAKRMANELGGIDQAREAISQLARILA